MRFHEKLFHYNLGPQGPAARLLRHEEAWVQAELARLGAEPAPATFTSFAQELKRVVRADASPGETGEFLAGRAGREQFKVVVGEYAPDGLTEASAMCHAIPRLPPEAQMPLVRVAIDEYGCGNGERAHAQLYRVLMEELGMDRRVGPNVAEASTPSLMAVNVWHWLTRRAPDIEPYLGALAYVEAAIPAAFQPFAAACERLGIAAHAYFTEHIHIDEYHARDALGIFPALARTRPVDFGRAWAGMRLVRRLSRRAFRTAIARSQEV
jgi:hypothetical protein